MGEFDDVGDFHHKFGLDSSTHRGAGPREIPPDLLGFRIKFMVEELLEFVKGSGMELEFKNGELAVVGPVSIEQNHAEMFDALIDLVYVAMGTAHLFGYPWRRGWSLVQVANMSKIRATEETASDRGGTWDVIKPPGWTPPDIEGILRQMGWSS